MIYECDLSEGAFDDYREKIALSDGTVQCCETGIMIPADIPYALCQGYHCKGYLFEEGWTNYPQSLEVWRWVRNLRLQDKACFCFSMIKEELYDAVFIDPVIRFWDLQIRSIEKRIRSRYASGKGPRLNIEETLALESDWWFDRIAWKDKPAIRFNEETHIKISKGEGNSAW